MTHRIVEIPSPRGADDAREDVVCPSCGTAGVVDVARRDATGFCVQCDYPLFWVPSRRVTATVGASDESALRRLPGTVGHARLVSLPCPHCTEPNLPLAVLCVRCGGEMNPAPVVPVVTEPIPVVVHEPEPSRPWWPIVLAAVLGLAALIALLLLTR